MSTETFEQGYTETCSPCCGNCQGLESVEKTPVVLIIKRFLR